MASHPASVFAHAKSLEAHKHSSAANDQMTQSSHAMAAEFHNKAATAHKQAMRVLKADSTKGSDSNPQLQRANFIESDVDSTPSDTRKSLFKFAGDDVARDEVSMKKPKSA